MRGIFKGAALKFPFFLVPFSFENERKRNSARRANTAHLRAIAKEEYGASRPIRTRSVICQPNLLLRIRPYLRHGRTSSVALRATPSPLDRRSQCIEGKARVRSTLYRCKFFLFFPLRTISSREARPVMSTTANMPFLIERTNSVQ